MPFQTVAPRWIFFYIFLEPLIFVCLFACCIIYKTVLHFCTAPLLCKFNTTYFFHTRKSSLPPCCRLPVCDLIRSHRWPGSQRKKQSQGNGIVKCPNLTEKGVRQTRLRQCEMWFIEQVESVTSLLFLSHFLSTLMEYKVCILNIDKNCTFMSGCIYVQSVIRLKVFF